MTSLDPLNRLRIVVGCSCGIFILKLLMHNVVALKTLTRTPKEIETALFRHGIVPQLIDHSPKHAVQVAYNGRAVDFGNNFTEIEIENEPSHISWPAEKDSLYTLILTGPDVPTHENPEDKECQHWIVGNIPGDNVAAGFNQTEYKGILSFYEYGCHRLIFMVFKQPDQQIIKFTEERREKKIVGYMRAFFHFKPFAEKYKLGEPIAVNFFLVHILPYPYNLTNYKSMHDIPSGEQAFKNPLTSSGILAQIAHQFF